MRTAGSTGTPLSVGMNQAERDLMRVVKMSAWQAFGYDRSSRLFLIWGHAHLLGTGWMGRVKHVKRRLADAALGYRRVDAYRLTTGSCAAYAEELIAFRPVGLIGYASALDLFARYTTAYRDRFRALGLALRAGHRRGAAAARHASTCSRITSAARSCRSTAAPNSGRSRSRQAARRSRPTAISTSSKRRPPQTTSRRCWSPPCTSATCRLIRYQVGDAVTEPVRLPHGHVTRFDAMSGRLNDVIVLTTGDVDS